MRGIRGCDLRVRQWANHEVLRSAAETSSSGKGTERELLALVEDEFNHRLAFLVCMNLDTDRFEDVRSGPPDRTGFRHASPRLEALL